MTFSLAILLLGRKKFVLTKITIYDILQDKVTKNDGRKL